MMRPKRRRQEVWQIKSVLKISLAEVAAVERIGEEWSGVEWSEVGPLPPLHPLLPPDSLV